MNARELYLAIAVGGLLVSPSARGQICPPSEYFFQAQGFNAGSATADVVLADLDMDDDLDAVVINEHPSLPSFNPGTISVLPGVPGGAGNTLGPIAQFPQPQTGEGPRAAVVGLFNGDAFPDVAVVNFRSSGGVGGAPVFDGTMSVLFGNGDLTLQPAVTLDVGIRPLGLAADDFDGDGSTDFAVANSTSDDLSLIRGGGDGTFGPEQREPIGSSPIAVVAGNFGGNELPDLAVLLSGAGTVVLFTNTTDVSADVDGSGVIDAFDNAVFFQAVADGDTDIADVDGVPGLAIGDLNTFASSLDGALGPVQLDFAIDDVLAIGTGNIQPSDLIAEDLDQDGALDLVVANNGPSPDGGNSIAVLLGDGAGGFDPAVFYSDFRGTQFLDPDSLGVGDINRDGTLDIVLGNATNDETAVAVFPGLGDGTFLEPICSSVDGDEVACFPNAGGSVDDNSGRGITVAVGQVDGLRGVDVVTAGGGGSAGVSLLTNNCPDFESQ